MYARASDNLMEYSLKPLNEILEDTDQLVRDAAAWVFKKLTINAIGLECIRDTGSANQMILSFISHSQQEGITANKGKYLILLLEAFSNLTINDYGIEPLLGKKAIYQFNMLLQAEYA